MSDGTEREEDPRKYNPFYIYPKDPVGEWVWVFDRTNGFFKDSETISVCDSILSAFNGFFYLKKIEVRAGGRVENNTFDYNEPVAAQVTRLLNEVSKNNPEKDYTFLRMLQMEGDLKLSVNSSSGIREEIVGSKRFYSDGDYCYPLTISISVFGTKKYPQPSLMVAVRTYTNAWLPKLFDPSVSRVNLDDYVVDNLALSTLNQAKLTIRLKGLEESLSGLASKLGSTLDLAIIESERFYPWPEHWNCEIYQYGFRNKKA